jgi:hypothetical protein
MKTMLEGRKQQIKVFALNLGADDEKSWGQA